MLNHSFKTQAVKEVQEPSGIDFLAFPYAKVKYEMAKNQPILTGYSANAPGRLVRSWNI